MRNAERTLQEVTKEFASVIPEVDRNARHERWDPGIGPFEEERQIEKILDGLPADHELGCIEQEVNYPSSGKRCDLRIQDTPIEVKLLRFRRDNGNIDPNMYKSVFSPFPERSSSSLLTDARKLVESGFDLPCGLVGIYYEKEDEEFEQLRAEQIAEKFERDVRYWYEIDIDVVAIENFDGLRHPHHQLGSVISWILR